MYMVSFQFGMFVVVNYGNLDVIFRVIRSYIQ